MYKQNTMNSLVKFKYLHWASGKQENKNHSATCQFWNAADFPSQGQWCNDTSAIFLSPFKWRNVFLMSCWCSLEFDSLDTISFLNQTTKDHLLEFSLKNIKN